MASGHQRDWRESRVSTYRKGGGKVLHCFLIWDYPEEVHMLVLDVLQVTLHHSESSCVVATTMPQHGATCCYLPLISRSVVTHKLLLL